MRTIRRKKKKNPFYELVRGKKTVFGSGLKEAFKKNPKLLIERGKKGLDKPSLFMEDIEGVRTTKNRRAKTRRENVVLIKTKQGKIISLGEKEFDALCYISAGKKIGVIQRKVDIKKERVNSLRKVCSNLPSSVQKKFAERAEQLEKSRKGMQANEISFHNTDFFRGKDLI